MSGTNRAQQAQNMFLNSGGIFAQPLAKLRDEGILAEEYVYREYPRTVKISRGVEEIACSTETIRGATLSWTERREMFDEIIVNSEDEEERVLNGGKTSTQLEQDRQDLIARCHAQGVRVDPSWSAVRLRRELGETLNAEPKDEMGALEKRLADLQKMADMRAKIAALEAQLTAPAEAHGEIDDMRTELQSLGVKVDARWGAARLRSELENARSGVAA